MDVGNGKKWAKWVFGVILIGIVGFLTYYFIWVNSPTWRRDMPRSEISWDEGSLDEFELLSDAEIYADKFALILTELGGYDVESGVGDYVVLVDVSEQKEYVFDWDGEVFAVYRVSTGAEQVWVPGETLGEMDENGGDSSEIEVESEAEPNENSDVLGEETEGHYENRSMGRSLWRVASKQDYSLSALYGARLLMLDRYVDGAWIRTNVALHGTEEPDRIGTPFTLGCVYHENADIIALYDILEVGDLVVAVE